MNKFIVGCLKSRLPREVVLRFPCPGSCYRDDFGFGPSWCYCFMQRNRLSITPDLHRSAAHFTGRCSWFRTQTLVRPLLSGSQFPWVCWKATEHVVTGHTIKIDEVPFTFDNFEINVFPLHSAFFLADATHSLENTIHLNSLTFMPKMTGCKLLYNTKYCA